MKIILTHGDLQQIYDIALYNIKNKGNVAIDSHLLPLSFMLQAFVDVVNKSGVCIELEQPARHIYSSIDEE